MEIVNESNCKPKKLWVDQGRELYNKLIPEWPDNNDILNVFETWLRQVNNLRKVYKNIKSSNL